MDTSIFILVAICFGVIVLWFWYRYKFKRLRTPCVTLVTGAPKSGKDLLLVDYAVRKYQVNHIAWWWKSHICKYLKKPIPEEPLFYVNQAFGFKDWKHLGKHHLDKNIRWITKGMLLRDERVAYKSVVFITELCLVADSKLGMKANGSGKKRVIPCIGDDGKEVLVNYDEIDGNITLFAKLFGHESHNGYLFCNTQNIQDAHFGFKRVASTFLFVQTNKWLPFFRLLYVRELMSADNDAVNNVESDVDDSMKLYLVPKRVFKRYNRWHFDYLTNDLPISDCKEVKREIVSFNPLYVALAEKGLKKENQEEKKEGVTYGSK